jgi:L-cysteine:1D-myo-inositol 2-amino-2-deoxy-alpha-D-glucopyranoside ligase
MHCAMVSLDGEKMSKSLGNLILAADLLKAFTPDAIRVMLLSHEYRQPWEYFTRDMVAAAQRADRLRAAAHTVEPTDEDNMATDTVAQRAVEAFDAALDNDLNTPAALDALDALATATLEQPLGVRVIALRELGGVLGLALGDTRPTTSGWTIE